jgi:hypothetical protein
VRAGLATVPVAILGGFIAQEYVEVHIFSWLTPALIGLAASWAASAAVARTAVRWFVPVFAAVAAGLLGTALGLRLYPNGPNVVLHPFSLVGWPYFGAVVGAVLWPLVVGGPRRAASDDAVAG